MTASPQLMTLGEVAEKLQMTPDGVYKLIQRGKLESVRISERKIRVPAESFERYYAQLEKWAQDCIAAQRPFSAAEARKAFEANYGQTTEAFVTAWKRDELEDSAENMNRLFDATGILSAEKSAHSPR
jgi:excisionase family DNA binding protein